MEPSNQTPPASRSAGGAGLAPNVASALTCPLGFITGIIFLLLEKDRSVRFHAWQSILVSVAWTGLFIVLSILSAVLTPIPGIGLIVMLLGLLVTVVWSVGAVALVILLMVMAFQGRRFSLPWIGPDGSLYVLQLLEKSLLEVQGGGGPPSPEALTGALIRVAPDSTKTEIASEGLVAPTGLTIADDGTIYVANSGIIAGQGQVVRLAGMPGMPDSGGGALAGGGVPLSGAAVAVALLAGCVYAVMISVGRGRGSYQLLLDGGGSVIPSGARNPWSGLRILRYAQNDNAGMSSPIPYHTAR